MFLRLNALNINYHLTLASSLCEKIRHPFAQFLSQSDGLDPLTDGLHEIIVTDLWSPWFLKVER